jgi:hypothetical protein
VAIKLWPTLTLRLEGGPDDGEERLVPAASSVVPPGVTQRLHRAEGEHVRHPELAAPWTWRYLRVVEEAGWLGTLWIRREARHEGGPLRFGAADPRY